MGASWQYVHIDWGETTVSDRTAECTSEGESRVEVDAGELLWGVGESLLDSGIDLIDAGLRRSDGHCVM